MDFFDELLTRNVERIYPDKKSLLRKLESDYKLTIYLGIDPSGPFVHLGHAIALRKLREFQNLGHKIILLIGDFTGMIGDPTGKDSARQPLTADKVLENASTYKKQAEKILNFSGKNPAELAYNSHWLSKLNFEQIVKLASHFTVSQFLERDMFQKRLSEKKPISLHEFLYPLMQGYDSVALDVDMEVGGTDQTFNMLVGRQLLNEFKNKEKFVLTLPLLEGTDGRKMSKSFNNTIDISSPPKEMFGKLMSLKDELILKYFEICTDIKLAELKKIQARIKKENPLFVKKELATEIVSLYHGEKETKEAKKEFERVVQGRQLPTEILEQELSLSDYEGTLNYAALSTAVGGTLSNSEALRLAQQGGYYFDDVKIEDAREVPSLKAGQTHLLKTGKRKVLKIKVIN